MRSRPHDTTVPELAPWEGKQTKPSSQLGFIAKAGITTYGLMHLANIYARAHAGFSTGAWCVALDVEFSAENFVVPGYFIQRALQCIWVHRPVQPCGECQVVNSIAGL